MQNIFKDKDERLDFFIALGVICLCGFFLWQYGFKTTGQEIIETDLSTTEVVVTDELVDYKEKSNSEELEKRTVWKKKEILPIATTAVTPVSLDADSDNDGIVDKLDACPTIAGTLLTKGCPVDSDKDGIPDTQDMCPEESGIEENNGCPEVEILEEEVKIVVVDTDGDGIEDEDDKCPELAGTVEESGCPEIKLEEEERKLITETIKNIEFETGSDKLTSSSKKILRSLSTLMKKYPDYKLTIAGHTDNRGGSERNLELSKERAASCAAYLVRYGIENERMSHNGYGDTEPIASNDSSSGRKQNRRVEFTLGY